MENRVVSMNIKWETTICEGCCKYEKCDDKKPCIALEMLRQLCLEPPGTQIQILGNVAMHFVYENNRRRF